MVVTATDRSGRQLRTVVRWAWLGWEGFGDGAVEVLLPEQSRGVEPRLSGGPQVLRVDAVRGAPDGDVAEQFGADGASWIDPGRPAVRFRGLSSDGLGELGEPSRVSCRIVFGQEGCDHAEALRRRGQGSGGAVGG